ncbi:MAG: phosphoribosyltransferase family protein [Ferruginibacter sp.]|nr:phosphoribosyltransferase [Ferruginibacter sp.]
MILTKTSADKKLRRMALEIAEHNSNITEILLIGIKENGIFIAKKIEQFLLPIFTGSVKTISLSINKKCPERIELSEEVNLQNKAILLVDDVANSGRTMLYALAPLLERYPSQIETLALVERTHKLFPVALNYVGLSVSTKIEENIEVIVDGGEVMGAVIKIAL